MGAARPAQKLGRFGNDVFLNQLLALRQAVSCALQGALIMSRKMLGVAPAVACGRGARGLERSPPRRPGGGRHGAGRLECCTPYTYVRRYR